MIGTRIFQVVVGAIAATRTVPDLSQTAFEELDLVIDLFEKARSHPVTKNGLVSKNLDIYTHLLQSVNLQTSVASSLCYAIIVIT